MSKILTPISHFFKNPVLAEKITALSDGLEARDHSVNYEVDKQLALHCELQPIHTLSDADFEYLRNVSLTKKNLKLVSFHIASCFDQPVIEDGVFQPGGNFFSREAMIDNARHNFRIIKEIFGPGILLALENNNYYPTEAYQYITDPVFLAELVHANNINFLFDIAHAKVSAHNQQLPYEAYVSKLPLTKAVQLHICRHGYADYKAYDAHFLPEKEDWDYIHSLIANYDIEYFTVEYYRDIEGLLNSLKQLRRIL